MGQGGPCRYFIFIFYAILYSTFIACYTHFVHPSVPYIYSSHIALHRVLTFLVHPWPWLIVLFLQFYDPGVITRENVNSYIALFPFDSVLYPPQFCRTLLIPAVARSRFCQYTNRRIAKYDHYCPWILAPIGLRTHRFFLLFLVLNDAAAAYYAVGCWRFLRWELSAYVIERSGGFWADLWIELIAMIRIQPFVAGIFLLLAGVVLFMTGFVFQQLYYTARNITQVEMDRIDGWRRKEEAEGRPNAVYVHRYDRGIWANLKEDCFPPRAARHPPVPLCEKPPEQVQEVKAPGNKTPRKRKNQ
jgi:palmitoyltransferase